jgi:WD40 repeat protein
VESVAFAPGGRLLAASTSGGPIRLFDPSTGRARGTLEASLTVDMMVFSPDGRTLATIAYHQRAAGATDTRLALWDTAQPDRAPEVLLDIGEDVPGNTGLAFSPDGRKLAVAGFTADPLVFDVDPDAWAERARRLSTGSAARG